MSIEIKLYVAGYCTHMAAMTLKGDPWQVQKYPAICALLKHPEHGYVLFDTGYSHRFFQETSRWPYSLYGRLTPTKVADDQTLVAQLERDGISPDDIGTVILSHFHADHVAGLADFPNARIISSKLAYEHVKDTRGFSALRKGFLPGLIPDDFSLRARFTEDRGQVCLPDDYKPFDTGFDIFGDGSAYAIDLPGHARYQFGILVPESDRGPTFLVADACWSSRAFRGNIRPAFLAYLIQDRKSEYDASLRKLHELHLNNPSLKLVPSHCQEIWAEVDPDHE